MSLGQVFQKAFALQTFPLPFATHEETKGKMGPSQEYYWCLCNVNLEGMRQRLILWLKDADVYFVHSYWILNHECRKNPPLWWEQQPVRPETGLLICSVVELKAQKQTQTPVHFVMIAMKWAFKTTMKWQMKQHSQHTSNKQTRTVLHNSSTCLL